MVQSYKKSQMHTQVSISLKFKSFDNKKASVKELKVICAPATIKEVN